MFRDIFCGQITSSQIGKTVHLAGWVASTRDHGGLLFCDLRDRTGVVQLTFHPDNKPIFEIAQKLGSEFVIQATGTVQARPAGTENAHIATGKVEVIVQSLEILNACRTLPFEISEFTKAGEETRLKYRFLDLRRPKLQRNLELRHKLTQAIRLSLTDQSFLEMETPFLTKSTPEGARDFLVPSRVNPGTFYALPQSPQLFKQILMVSGYERYFQVARCFRDEDLRADRQPEFTQIDLEMSFIEEKDVMDAVEQMVTRSFAAAGMPVPATPFPRMGYDEAMGRFGSDKPDLRFGLELQDVTAWAAATSFQVFSKSAVKGSSVRVIRVPGGASMPRTQIDDLTQLVQSWGAGGLAWMKVTEAGFDGSIVKFFKPEELAALKSATGAETGEILFFGAGKNALVLKVLGLLRIELANRLKLIPENVFRLTWVVKFPLLAFDEEEKRWVACHHPFTAPSDWAPVDEVFASGKTAEYITNEESPLGGLKARAYDLVMNGTEIGGGSIRIHQPERQNQIFKLLNIPEAVVQLQFAFLLEALSYGAPPHGGFALGLDRFTAILAGDDTIRDVIAFPKTQRGQCLMSGAPSRPSDRQLKELGLPIPPKPPHKNSSPPSGGEAPVRG